MTNTCTLELPSIFKLLNMIGNNKLDDGIYAITLYCEGRATMYHKIAETPLQLQELLITHGLRLFLMSDKYDENLTHIDFRLVLAVNEETAKDIFACHHFLDTSEVNIYGEVKMNI